MYDIIELSGKLLPDLKEIAKELDIKKIESFKKQDLIYKILDTQAILASEKKTDDKRLKSPRDVSPKKEENALKKFFNFKKEEKVVENTEEKTEVEKQSSLVEPEIRKEGKREFQIKKRPRTEHIKAGSSNHNSNQNPKPAVNPGQNPNQNPKPLVNPNQNPKPNQNIKQEQRPVQKVNPNSNQHQKVRQEILLPEEPVEIESENIISETAVFQEPISAINKESIPESVNPEESRAEESIERRNDNLNKKNNLRWENRENQGPKQPKPQQNQEKPYEFDGIISNTGVLEIMVDGY